MRVLKHQRNNKEVEEVDDDIIEDNEIDQNDEGILMQIERGRLEDKRIKGDKKILTKFSKYFFVFVLKI